MRTLVLVLFLFQIAISDTRVGAICDDGTMSNGTNSDACAGHGGVQYWISKDGDSYDTLSICSFNIQFLGHFKSKKNEALAQIVKDYDIVVIQELVAPPSDGTYPDGEKYTHDPEAKQFFDAMHSLGFESILSNEDTGTRDEIHKKTSATEWWCAFYKPGVVQPNDDLPHGFLAEDRSNHPDYERVPYAFAFNDNSGNLDFVLISVHLMPGDSKANMARRNHELNAINEWISSNNSKEKDFIILGDMNIKNSKELETATPHGFLSLNDECFKTNTATKAKPYDHVMYNLEHTSREIDTKYDIKVVDLVKAARPTWTSSSPYPGDPYKHDKFRQAYSDHHPIVFKMIVRNSDDD